MNSHDRSFIASNQQPRSASKQHREKLTLTCIELQTLPRRLVFELLRDAYLIHRRLY